MAHLNDYLRFGSLLARQWVRPVRRMGMLDTDRVEMTVWPSDLDFNLHLTNSRFLSCMDYGRLHMMAATGMFDLMWRERYAPLVGGIDIVYRRSLPLFGRFALTSRTVCWDEKWFYLEQRMESAAGLVAQAWVKGIFRGREGNVAPGEMVERIAPGLVSPALPEGMRQWNGLVEERLRGSEGPSLTARLGG